MDTRLQFRFTSSQQEEDALRLKHDADLSQLAEPIVVPYQEHSVLVNYLRDGLEDLEYFNPDEIKTKLDTFYINYNNVLHRFEVTAVPNPLMFHRKFTQASLINPEEVIETMKLGMNSFLLSLASEKNVNFETEKLNFISRLWLTDLDTFIKIYLAKSGNFHMVRPAHIIAQTALPLKKLLPQVEHDLSMGSFEFNDLRHNAAKLKKKLKHAYPHLSQRYVQDLTDLLFLTNSD